MEAKSGNAALLRRMNSGVILDALRAGDALTIADLARLTGLSLATCATIARDLAADGRAILLGEKTTRGGRPARRYRYNPDHTLIALVLPLTGSAGEILKITLVNTNGDIVTSSEQALGQITPAPILAALEQLRREYANLGAVAVSIPGVVRNGTVRSCDIPGLEKLPLAKLIRDRIDLPVIIDNDMTLSALGLSHRLPPEWPEAGDRRPTLAYMAVPLVECIGTGIVVQGVIHRGKSYYAGELGAVIDAAAESSGHAGGLPLPAKVRLAVLILVASINPDIVVLTGEGVGPAAPAEITAALRQRLPEEHLPALMYRPDFEPDCRAGMLDLALASLSEPA